VFLVVERLEKAPEGSAVRHAGYAEAQVVRTVVEVISWVVLEVDLMELFEVKVVYLVKHLVVERAIGLLAALVLSLEVIPQVFPVPWTFALQVVLLALSVVVGLAPKVFVQVHPTVVWEALLLASVPQQLSPSYPVLPLPFQHAEPVRAE
jgi:hypothetical protein